MEKILRERIPCEDCILFARCLSFIYSQCIEREISLGSSVYITVYIKCEIFEKAIACSKHHAIVLLGWAEDVFRESLKKRDKYDK